MTGTPGDVMRAMVAAFATGVVADVVHPDYLDHQGLDGERPLRGPEGFARVVEVARRAYAELDVTIVDLVEGPDRAAARIAWRGVRATGEITERETIDIVRVEDGRAVEHWGGRSSP
ncbi:MAG TPA: ester cyclase [Iamia sp.]